MLIADKIMSFLQQVQAYRDTQLAKDAKLCGAVMAVTLLILCHYVYVIKRWIDNPNISYTEMSVQFGLWAVSASGLIYSLVYKIYPLIAGEDVTTEKKDQ